MSRTSSSWRSALAAGLLARFLLGLGDEDVAIIVVPSRNPVTPPQLARDAPGLDILEPVEPGLLPGLGDDLDLARSRRLDRRLGQRRGVDIPLVGQPRLDHHARAVAERRRDDAVLDLVQRAFGFEQFDHALAGVEPVEAEQLVRDQPVAVWTTRACAIEHVEHLGRLEPGALADLEIVEVVARRDLDRACCQARGRHARR